MDETASKVKLDQVNSDFKINGQIPRVTAEDVRDIVREYKTAEKE